VLLDTGAVHSINGVQSEEVAFHFVLQNGESAALNRQVASLRKLLLSGQHMGESNQTDSSPIAYARKMFDGNLPIAVTVDSADVISRLIVL
jgi:hypothetical protein